MTALHGPTPAYRLGSRTSSVAPSIANPVLGPLATEREERPGVVRSALADDHALVWLDGEFDLASAARLKVVADELAAAGRPAVVVDATTVGFADSTLMNFLAVLARQGGVTMCNPSPEVRELMALCGLGSVVGVVDAPIS